MSFKYVIKNISFRKNSIKNGILKNIKNNLYKIYQVVKVGELSAHVIDYQYIFKLKTIDLCDHVVKYIEGLFCAERSKAISNEW